MKASSRNQRYTAPSRLPHSRANHAYHASRRSFSSRRTPLLWEFKQLGVGQRLTAGKGTGPVVRGRLDKGLAIIHWVGCLPTFLMREAALGILANSMALYGVELADVEGRTLLAADTAAAKAI